MIDAVSTLTVQTNTLRSASQNAVAASSTQSIASQINFVGSRIRIDNLLDIAIMEFRSVETGDVIRQFPSEPQIRAFQRAAAIEARTSAAAAYEAKADAGATITPGSSDVDTTSGGEVQVVSTAPVDTYSAPEVSMAPVVASSAPVDTSAGTSPGGEVGGGQSILV